VKNDWYIHKLDFETAFLNSDVDREVYMKQIKGYDNGTSQVLKLQKALYGLHQSPRCWQTKLVSILRQFGFTPFVSDESVLTNGTLLVPVFVDDLLVMGKNEIDIEKLKSQIKAEYRVKDFGRMTEFLGLQWHYADGKAKLSQPKYIQEVLKRFGMEDCKPAPTPMVEDREMDETALMKDSTVYKEASGCLVYLSNSTRADIAYAVSVIASKTANPTQKDWIKVKRLLRYLQGTLDHGIEFSQGKNTGIQVYADASFSVTPGERTSRTGYSIFHDGNLVCWYSKKQPGLPALSTVEAEFRSASTALPEAF
jgi:histone deacetylase 1/2